MFNLQGSEIIFILLLALVVLGPEKLPGAIRRFTRTYAELRKMGTSFQQEVKTAFDEPMREVRETADLIKQQVDVDTLDTDDEVADRPVTVTEEANEAAAVDDALSPPVAGTARPGPGTRPEVAADPDPGAMPPPPPTASPSPPPAPSPSAIPAPPPPFSSANGIPRADLPAPDLHDGVSDEQRGAPSP